MTVACGHVQSYYAASADIPSPAPALAGTASADVGVVGAGIAGCTAALELAERGYRVCLLEAGRVGWDASGRNGGQVLPGYAKSLPELAQLVGNDDAARMWEVSVEAVAQLRARIARHGIGCDWQDGVMHVADKPRQVDELARWRDELVRHHGYHAMQFIAAEELAGLLATSRYQAALLDTGAGHLHPLRYTLGLAAAARAAGVVLHEGTRMTRFERAADGRVRVRAQADDGAEGELLCRHLVLAAGARIDSAAPKLARRIMPVGTYLVATEPLGAERAARLIRNNAAVSDLNWIIDYFRLSADHRLLFGGRLSYSGLRPDRSGAATRQRMLRVFPQLADVRVEYSWGGYLDISLNRAPDFGRLADNVWYMQGFSGHGVALSGMSGRLAAQAIAGQSERFDLFARIPHHAFPGGQALRRPALVLAMLWYRLRDLL